MPGASRSWTADMVRALPDDGKRYELVHGELLVTPAPRAVHQAAVSALHLALAPACRRSGMYRVWLSPADISWGHDTLVQPDVFVVPAAESATMDWTKMRTLWLVDLDARHVEVWTPDAHFPLIETERVTWEPGKGMEPVSIALDALFT